MDRSKVAPPGARIPLLVLLAALAGGALIFLQVHRGPPGAPGGSRSFVVAPAQTSPAAQRTASP